ncbi:two-component system, chemotaxis family, sensor kinase CheA [Candidatus Magnetomoraceae bacterium gMMP-15]
MIDQAELITSFVEESQEHLQLIEPDLLALEKGGDDVDPDVINRIFRGVHSLKGASGFFGFQNIGNLSHVMENLLSLVRDGKLNVSPELTDGLLSGMDALTTMVDDVSNSDNFDIQKEFDKLQKLWNEVSEDSSKTVTTVAEKKDSDDKIQFNLSEEQIKRFADKGKYLYSVRISINEDLKAKNRTPYEFIKTIESLGEYVESFPDISNISGLNDCLSDEIALNFVFATIMEKDLVSIGLDISKDAVLFINIDDYKIQKPSQKSIEKDKKPEKKTKTSQPPSKKPKVQAEEKIRVGVSFLNDLVNIAGELVLGRNQLMQTALPFVKDAPGLNTILQHINRVTSDMQEKIMQMRMQPVSVLFGKFHRIVRDLSKNLKKEIRLETQGEDVELDKSIIEALSDPLTHLIRNSVDHGIESQEERELKGKPRPGKLLLKAYHEGGQVHLEIIDDGKGIDGELLGRKAIEKGLISEAEFESMKQKDLVKLIFRPGFSTTEKVSSISGRGVGMDVVMTNIKQLGGTVDIDTTIDQGTRMHLVLPLTLAIVSGLVVKIYDQFFILPESNIDEMVRIKPEEIEKRINIIQNSQVLRLRDVLLPLINLKDTLKLQEFKFSNFKSAKQSQDEDEIRLEPMRILVIKHGQSRFGLIVDSVENIEEIVVKPLPRYLKNMKSFSGASIMGNGTVSLILDVAGIVEKASLHSLRENIDEMAREGRGVAPKDESQTLILFDNKTEEQFAFPLQLITRIENVPASRVEHIQDKTFLQYQGENLRLIFLEDYLPISKPERDRAETIGVIVPKHIKYPMGIVMHDIIGTIDTIVKIDTSTVTAPGLFGTDVINDKITLFPDMYRLFEMARPEGGGLKKDEDVSYDDQRKKRILLAEDTPFFRMMANEYLTSAGYEVVQAENGKKALERLGEQNFDAVVSDIVMPQLDGWGLIKAIREEERWKDLPVLAVTSLSDDKTAQKGIKAGFTAWELKLNKERLLQRLEEMT